MFEENIYDKCELFIRTPSGQLVNLGKIASTSVRRVKAKANPSIPLDEYFTVYSFKVDDFNTGDYDGDDFLSIDQNEWEQIIKG